MAVSALRFILGDQLTGDVSSLRDIEPSHDLVLMVEVTEETNYVRHHRQKLVFVLSAMRHFAEQLRSEGIKVRYVRLDDDDNTGSLSDELARAVKDHDIEQVVITQPGEWRVAQMVAAWKERLGIKVDLREDDRFLCGIAEFVDWARGRKSMRMEHFYRLVRRKTGWLMDDGKPLGGKWNYDAENRKRLGNDVAIPERLGFAPDKITDEVITLVKRTFPDNFGEIDGFRWAISREEALKALDSFLTRCLTRFGDYQDAMKEGQDFLFHGLLSPYINIGLLTPTEVCRAVLAAYEQERIPLNATEGFLRQVIGWREYVRGIYWLRMPDYRDTNFFSADRHLPAFFWTGETKMNCIARVVSATRRNAYAHHIQRLMITGNFALLTGISPAEVEEWYLAVYADAYEWVELPNTHGMALHADGGVLGSKPYAASGSYINRMSDYCKDCEFDPKLKLGLDACPFNYLYWYFLIRNQSRLADNPRMGMPYHTLKKMNKEKRDETICQAENFLDRLD